MQTVRNMNMSECAWQHCSQYLFSASSSICAVFVMLALMDFYIETVACSHSICFWNVPTWIKKKTYTEIERPLGPYTSINQQIFLNNLKNCRVNLSIHYVNMEQCSFICVGGKKTLSPTSLKHMHSNTFIVSTVNGNIPQTTIVFIYS